MKIQGEYGPGKLSGLMEEEDSMKRKKIYGIFMLVAIAVFICRRKDTANLFELSGKSKSL